MHLRQVSRGEFGVIYPSGDLLFEFIETAPQRAGTGGDCRQCKAKAWTQDSRVGSRAKEGNPEAKTGQAVAVRLGNPFNQSVKAETA